MWVQPVPPSCGIDLGMDSLRSALRWACGLSAGLWAARSPLRTPGFPPGAGIAALGAGWAMGTPERAPHFPSSTRWCLSDRSLGEVRRHCCWRLTQLLALPAPSSHPEALQGPSSAGCTWRGPGAEPEPEPSGQERCRRRAQRAGCHRDGQTALRAAVSAAPPVGAAWPHVIAWRPRGRCHHPRLPLPGTETGSEESGTFFRPQMARRSRAAPASSVHVDSCAGSVQTWQELGSCAPEALGAVCAASLTLLGSGQLLS